MEAHDDHEVLSRKHDVQEGQFSITASLFPPLLRSSASCEIRPIGGVFTKGVIAYRVLR